MAAPVNPVSAQFIDAAFWDQEIFDRWMGVQSSWTSYTPVWTASSGTPSVGTGQLLGAYKRWDVSKTVHFRILLTTGSTTAYGTGQWSFSLPSGLAPAVLTPVHGHIQDTSVNNNRYACTGLLNSTSGGMVERIAVNGTLGVSGTIPHTWGAGDVLVLGGTYETT